MSVHKIAVAAIVVFVESTSAAAVSGCHCDGTLVHCHDAAEEKHCSCSASGVLTCEDLHLFDCHCDGSAVHCMDGTDEALCHCHDGAVHCDEPPAFDCHCDGSHVHCVDGTNESLCHCESNGDVHCDISTYSSSSSTTEPPKPWAQVIVTTLVTNLVTLAGLTVLAAKWVHNLVCPAHRRMNAKNIHQWKTNIIPMFACGAMLATTLFLILPEAMHLIAADFPASHHHHRALEGGEEYTETDTTWRWGTAVLGGYFLPIVTHALIPHGHDDHKRPQDDPQDAPASDTYLEKQDTSQPASFEDEPTSTTIVAKDKDVLEGVSVDDVEDGETAKVHDDNTGDGDTIKEHFCSISPKNIALLLSLTIADFFHQFSDGIFIGTAWFLCDDRLAITIAIATIIHCFPHQLADFLLMVNQCGLKEWQALLANFLTGLGTVLGGIIVLAIEPSSSAIGVILCVGGGIFLHVACSECLPLAQSVQYLFRHMVWGWLGFLVGCIPIGLVLLNHEHCGGH